jgi:hypothetical protein
MTFNQLRRESTRHLFLLGKVWVAVLCLLLTSCDNVSCPLNNKVECVYGFYATNQTAEEPFANGKAVSVGDTITITALGPDTILANKLVNQSGVNLPVSFYGDVDVLQFKFTDLNDLSAYDTIWVEKKNQHHWDDPSCAVHVWHTLTAVHSTHHLIDSVLIKNREINYDGLENIQIFFRTSSGDDEDDSTAEEL